MLEDPNLRNQRATILDRRHPNGCCQAFVSSDHSLGPVGDEEILTKILVSPFHVDRKKGLMLKGAIGVAELSGLSVVREAQATDEEIRRTAEALVMKARASNQPKAFVYGVAKFACRVIRKFQCHLDYGRSYCVYDTALEESIAHAEVFQRVNNTDKIIIEERRRLLLAELNEIGVVPARDYRNGLLSHLSPP